MSDEGRFTFAHFVDPESLEDRVRELDGRYEPEQIAATAFYLGVLSLAGLTSVTRVYGDQHYIFHLMANVYIGDWLTDLVIEGVVDPERMYDYVVRQYGDRIGMRSDGMEENAPRLEDGLPPMDKDTFSRLWGGS